MTKGDPPQKVLSDTGAGWPASEEGAPQAEGTWACECAWCVLGTIEASVVHVRKDHWGGGSGRGREEETFGIRSAGDGKSLEGFGVI